MVGVKNFIYSLTTASLAVSIKGCLVLIEDEITGGQIHEKCFSLQHLHWSLYFVTERFSVKEITNAYTNLDIRNVVSTLWVKR